MDVKNLTVKRNKTVIIFQCSFIRLLSAMSCIFDPEYKSLLDLRVCCLDVVLTGRSENVNGARFAIFFGAVSISGVGSNVYSELTLHY